MKEGVQMSFGMILDLLIMACGVYMVYWAVQMRSTNEIPAMLVGKGFPVSRAKDPEGFIRYTFPFTFATGAILFAAVLIGYGMMLMKAQKKYLVGIK